MKNIIYIILTAILLCIILHQHSVINQPLPPVQVKTDTIYKKDTITLPLPIPYKVKVNDTIYIPINDSINESDTLKLSKETKLYKDSLYEAQISGFQPSLDWIKVFPTNTTIYTEKVIYKPKKGFKIAPTVGVGYGFINRKPDLWLGIGLSYNF